MCHCLACDQACNMKTVSLQVLFDTVTVSLILSVIGLTLLRQGEGYVTVSHVMCVTVSLLKKCLCDQADKVKIVPLQV